VALAHVTTLWLERGRVNVQKWKEQKVLHDAAIIIQRNWKGFIKHKKMLSALVTRQKLANVEWRIRFWLRCCRRKLHAQNLR